MKTRLLFVPLLVATVATVAACGGGVTAVPAGDVALVDSTPITNAQFNATLAQAESQEKAAGQTVPQLGTPEYTTLKDQVVAYLVRNTEYAQQAAKLGIKVTPKDIDAYIKNVAKLKYGGSMKKLLAALKTGGLTLEQAQQLVLVNLTAQKIQTKVTSAAKVTTAEEMAYYNANLSTYKVPAQTTRNIEYILFKCAPTGSTTCAAAKNRAEKKLADKVEQKLQNGASFAAMAKQYSDDSSTASNGGHLCISKSGQSGSCIQTVPAFSNVGFALETGKISQPVDATSVANQGYGWFIVKALAPEKNTKAHTTPFKEAQATIEQTLLQPKQETLWSTWLANLEKNYAGKISYAAGYAPPATTAISTISTVGTTG